MNQIMLYILSQCYISYMLSRQERGTSFTTRSSTTSPKLQTTSSVTSAATRTRGGLYLCLYDPIIMFLLSSEILFSSISDWVFYCFHWCQKISSYTLFTGSQCIIVIFLHTSQDFPMFTRVLEKFDLTCPMTFVI